MTIKKIITISSYTKSSLASIRIKNESYDEIIKKLIQNWHEKPTMDRYRCRDNRPKKRRLVFDGGQIGKYSVDLCEVCYPNQDKKFLIEEIRLIQPKSEDESIRDLI